MIFPMSFYEEINQFWSCKVHAHWNYTSQMLFGQTNKKKQYIVDVIVVGGRLYMTTRCSIWLGQLLNLIHSENYTSSKINT